MSRRVNQITYDLIKDKYGWALKGHESNKGEKINLILSNSYWVGTDCKIEKEYPTDKAHLIKQFRIR